MSPSVKRTVCIEQRCTVSLLVFWVRMSAEPNDVYAFALWKDVGKEARYLRAYAFPISDELGTESSVILEYECERSEVVILTSRHLFQYAMM